MQAHHLKILKFIICCFTSVVCLIYLVQKIDMHVVVNLFSNINFTWFFIATLVGISKMWWTGLRWRYLGGFCNKLKKTYSFYFYTIGTMTNMFLPFRTGDLLRTRLIAQKLRVSNFKILATIASEHILDLLVLLSFSIACVFFYSYHWPNHIIITMVTILSIVMTCMGIIFLLKRTINIHFFKKFPYLVCLEKLSFFKKFIDNFSAGFFQFEDPVNTRKVITLTALIWLAQCLWIYALFHCIDLTTNYNLGIEAVFIIVVMMGIAAMLPATPGYIGTFHLMVVLGLTQMGVSKSTALSYAILAHAHSVIWAVLIGLYSLWQINMKIPLNSQELTKISEAAQ